MLLPPTFVVRSRLGVFAMDRIDAGDEGKTAVYAGSANGLELRVEAKAKNGRFEAECYSRAAYRGFEDSRTKGSVARPEDLPAAVCRWLDGFVPGEGFFESRVRRLKTSRGEVAYYAFNVGLGGTPAVFLHGGPGGGSNPQRTCSLALDRPVYCYDQLGCGLSDPIPDLKSWTAEDYADELEEVLAGLGLEKAVLIGASWGAGLAVQYAVRRGCGRIEAMVLVSPFLSSRIWYEDQMRNLEAMSPVRAERMRTAIETGDSETCRRIMRVYNGRFLFSKRENRAIARAAADEPPNPVSEAMIGPNEFLTTGTLKDFDVARRLSRIKAPTLLMAGDSDEVSVETMLAYRSGIKGSRLAVVPHAGHALAFEQPEIYRECIAAFLEENSLRTEKAESVRRFDETGRKRPPALRRETRRRGERIADPDLRRLPETSCTASRLLGHPFPSSIPAMHVRYK